MPGASIDPYAGLFGSAFLDQADLSQPFSCAVLERFDLLRSEVNFAGLAALNRADLAAEAWSLAYQRMLLDVVEALAQAETLHQKWNAKDLRPLHECIFGEVFKALELLEAVQNTFTHPSDGIAQFLAGTMDFVDAAFDTMSLSNAELADLFARARLSLLGVSGQVKGASNVLLAELVALALGQDEKGAFEESALRRRYLEDRPSRRRKMSLATVDRVHWRQYLKLRKWSMECALPQSQVVRSSISQSIRAFLDG